MYKKLLFSALMLATSSSIFAYSAPYVGASIGVTANTVINVNQFNFNNSSYRGMPVTVFVGFGAVLENNFYIGGEVTGTPGAFELNNNGLKTSYGYGASVMPGFMMCDHTLAFVRLGILSARFPNNDNSSTGGQMGIGIQSGLTQNVDLRGEYDYIVYRTISDIRGKAPNQVDYSVAPRADQFVIALVYKFD